MIESGVSADGQGGLFLGPDVRTIGIEPGSYPTGGMMMLVEILGGLSSLSHLRVEVTADMT